jgi:ABC-2 type transport system permease protein
MTQLATMVWAKTRMARNEIASIGRQSHLKVGVVTVSAILLWFGAYYAFFEGFMYLQRFGLEPAGATISLGDIIMTRLLSVFSLALLFLLTFSNALISFSTLYRSKEVAYLLQAPVPHRTFFLARFMECVVFSSWASAFLGSPLVLAYGIATDAPMAFYGAAVAFYVPFVTVPAALGCIVTMSLVRIFPALPRGSLFLLAFCALGGFFIYIRGIFSAANLSDDTILPAILSAMNRTQSAALPSYWAAHGILSAATGDYASSLFHFLLLFSNALMLTLVASEFAHRLFYPGWVSLSGNSARRRGFMGRRILSRLEAPLRILSEPHRSMVTKDIRLFWRDPVQWSQFLIFFGVMAVYIANLSNRTLSASDVYRSWIACLNIGACTLILATLTSRFVFPLVSLEGRRIWVLGLAPVTFRQVIWNKFWMSVVTTSVFTIPLVVLSCAKLGVAPVPFMLAVYSIVITNLGLSGLAVGLGSLYPNFHEDNPARIVSGMGGTLNFLLSMGYLVVVVGAQTFILQWRVLERYTAPETFWYALAAVFVLITVLSAASTLIPMRLGLRNLFESEF